MYVKLVCFRKKKLNREGLAPIEVLIYVDRSKRIYRSTGYAVPLQFWDFKNSRLKTSYPKFSKLNKSLLLFKNKMEEEFLSDENCFDKDRKTMFYDYFENRVIKISNANLSKGSNFIYKRTHRYLKEFEPEDFDIKKFDLRFVEKFDLYLKNVKQLQLNTRASLLKKLKKVVSVAISDDLMKYNENPFLFFKIKEIEPEKESLTVQDVKRIEDLDMSLYPELRKTRDMFLFACYTSMRFSDLVDLTCKNFEVLEGNRIRLSYAQQKLKHKTAKKIEWILSDFWKGKADDIILPYIETYQNYADETIYKYKFFEYSNQYYNRNLKELQRIAGIKTKLTSHLARHTCITLLVNDYGFPIEKVQLIAGHSKIEMTQRYLKITERDLSNAAKKVDW